MAALDLVRRFPESGVVVRGAKEGTRYVLLETSRYHVYYLPDEEVGLLRVYAIWGAQRARRPALPKPRAPRRRR